MKKITSVRQYGMKVFRPENAIAAANCRHAKRLCGVARTWQEVGIPARIAEWLACGEIFAMEIDTDRIDDAVLALLHLTLHDECRAGKGFDGDVLGRLHQKGMIDDPAGTSETVALTSDGLQRSKELFEAMFAVRQTVERPEMAAVLAPGKSLREEQPCRYPHIKVKLADLGGQLWPILRRVSYAMSDADIDEAEIEQYKTEVKASGDPVGVSSRWVHVKRKTG